MAFLKSNRSDLVRLDCTTRYILRKFRCYQYGALTERLYLPRGRGGRGTYEREVVSTAMYICCSEDPQLQGVVKHQLWLAGRGRCNVLQKANAILGEYQLGISVKEVGPGCPNGDRVTPKHHSQVLKAAQMEALSVSLSDKLNHGVFFRQKSGGRL